MVERNLFLLESIESTDTRFSEVTEFAGLRVSDVVLGHIGDADALRRFEHCDSALSSGRRRLSAQIALT